MAITTDYILKGGLKSSDEAANNRLKMMDEERIRGQSNASEEKRTRMENDAKLAQLIKGKQLDMENSRAEYDQVKNDAQEAARHGRKITAKMGNSMWGDSETTDGGRVRLTPGQEAADKNFGKEYSDYVAGGGSESAKKNLGLLENVQKELSDPDAPAPNMLERGVQALPDSLRAFLTPKIKMQEDQVRSAIQGSLRQTLGAQFTEKEGEGLMRRSYDPRMSPAQNLAKMKPEIDALKAQIMQKQRSAEQFERTGSLVGLGAAGGSGPSSIVPSQPSDGSEEPGTIDDAAAETAYQDAVRAQGRGTSRVAGPETKQIGGKTYVKVPGGWKAQ